MSSFNSKKASEKEFLYRGNHAYVVALTDQQLQELVSVLFEHPSFHAEWKDKQSKKPQWIFENPLLINKAVYSESGRAIQNFFYQESVEMFRTPIVAKGYYSEGTVHKYQYIIQMNGDRLQVDVSQ